MPGVDGLMAISPNSFSRGVTLKREGKFADAMPYFAQVAGLGFGYEVAQYNLGDCILRLGDAADDPHAADQKYREGAVWVALAAQSGDVNAQALFAELLYAGKGVPADPNAAAMYLNLADGNSRNEFMLGERREGLDTVRHGLSPEQLEEGRTRALGFDVLVQTQRSLPQMERRERPRRQLDNGRPGSGQGHPGGGGDGDGDGDGY